MRKNNIEVGHIEVVDSTLRDGEQQVFVNFTKEDKKEIASAIKELGVDYIDIMLDDSSEHLLSDYPVAISTPLITSFIEKAIYFRKPVILFCGVSDILLSVRGKGDIESLRKKNITDLVFVAESIRNYLGDGVKLFVVGEDSSRADQFYLKDVVNSVSSLCDVFIIADSVGCLNPQTTRNLVSFLKRETKVRLGIHTHNDLGYADRNTVEAVLSGAEIISGTFTGIGERAGNANLHSVLIELRDKYRIVSSSIRYDRLQDVDSLVRRLAKIGPAEPFSQRTSFVESGIHVNALLMEKNSYCAYDPKLLGFEHTVFFSKKSGISNLKWYLKDSFTDDQYRSWINHIKEYSLKLNKSLTFSEVKEFLKI